MPNRMVRRWQKARVRRMRPTIPSIGPLPDLGTRLHADGLSGTTMTLDGISPLGLWPCEDGCDLSFSMEHDGRRHLATLSTDQSRTEVEAIVGARFVVVAHLAEEVEHDEATGDYRPLVGRVARSS